MIIKNAAKSFGHSVGPVFLLSYKNHALDECLVDVIKFSDGTFNNGRLVRVGNPENEILRQYTERSSSNEKEAEDELVRRIKAARNIQRVSNDWKDCSQHFKTKAFIAVTCISNLHS